MTDLEQKCNEYREYKRLAEQAEQMRDSLRDEIITMMQGAPEIVAGACKVMYKDVSSVRLDSKLLPAAHPDIYAECSKRTTYKRFSVVYGGATSDIILHPVLFLVFLCAV